MAIQFVQYPSASTGATTVTANQGTPGPLNAPWPVKPTDGTNSQSFTASGEAKVDVTTTVLPPGASTLAAQNTGNASVASLDSKTVHVDTGAVVVASSALPSGAATAANQATEISSLSTIATNTTGVATAANQTTGNNSLSTIVTNTTGLATAANQTNGTQVTTVSNFPATTLVNQNSSPWLTREIGANQIDLIRLDYTSTNVTTGAYVQIKASTPAQINRIDIFDSSGSTLVFAIGAAASEVDKFYIWPGGNGTVYYAISAGLRLSVKAVDTNATTGELIINCWA